jgi:hypothetical protein
VRGALKAMLRDVGESEARDGLQRALEEVERALSMMAPSVPIQQKWQRAELWTEDGMRLAAGLRLRGYTGAEIGRMFGYATGADVGRAIKRLLYQHCEAEGMSWYQFRMEFCRTEADMQRLIETVLATDPSPREESVGKKLRKRKVQPRPWLSRE